MKSKVNMKKRVTRKDNTEKRSAWILYKTDKRLAKVGSIADLQTVSIAKLFDKLVDDEISRKNVHRKLA
jgi:hypothetical protein